MSFSSELKSELGNIYDGARHCRLAELASLICFAGKIEYENGKAFIEVVSENQITTEVFSGLIRRLFSVECEITDRKSSRNLKAFSAVTICDESDISALKIKEACKMGAMPDIAALTVKSCCKRAFMRGAFIAAGAVSNPDKFYHFEITGRTQAVANETAKLMQALGLQAKVIERQSHHVVYLKEIEQISDAVGLMGARRSLLELENFRILRGMRGNINRRVNCETANINKAAQAAARQIEDIRFIGENIGLAALPDGLDEMARVRLEYPEATLGELGTHLEPPIGKSGVNHRLRKISEIAMALRSRGGSYYD